MYRLVALNLISLWNYSTKAVSDRASESKEYKRKKIKKTGTPMWNCSTGRFTIVPLWCHVFKTYDIDLSGI